MNNRKIKKSNARELFKDKLTGCPVKNEICGFYKDDMCHKTGTPTSLITSRHERRVRCPHKRSPGPRKSPQQESFKSKHMYPRTGE